MCILERPAKNNRWKRFEDYMTKEIVGFSNYRVKILLDLVKILQIAFFGVCRVKILLYVVKILQILILYPFISWIRAFSSCLDPSFWAGCPNIHTTIKKQQ